MTCAECERLSKPRKVGPHEIEGKPLPCDIDPKKCGRPVLSEENVDAYLVAKKALYSCSNGFGGIDGASLSSFIEHFYGIPASTPQFQSVHEKVVYFLCALRSEELKYSGKGETSPEAFIGEVTGKDEKVPVNKKKKKEDKK